MPRLDQSGSFLGPALTVLSSNVEGLSIAKQQILAELCSNLHCDVLCLQETHRGSNNNRPSIPGMVPVANNDDATCECGTEPNLWNTLEMSSIYGTLLRCPLFMEHLLRCPLLEHDCKVEDLAEYNECARNCVQLWLKHNI